MKNWLKIERIPGPLASSYEKATRLAIDMYYREVIYPLKYSKSHPILK
jgi:hypothetical protein